VGKVWEATVFLAGGVVQVCLHSNAVASSLCMVWASNLVGLQQLGQVVLQENTVGLHAAQLLNSARNVCYQALE
jgi:hypothetical protein